MFVESSMIRRWLDAATDSPSEHHKNGISQLPRAYNVSTNPIPALIILLLGIMMSSHHQSSMTSTTIHKQWGTLLAGFSVMRLLTCIIMYVSPPTTVHPMRPPSELVSSFCLISGGIVFMASTKDIVHWVEVKEIMPMLVFTVAMGLTTLITAWQILVLSIKGWATRRGAIEGTQAEDTLL